ncbi:hypothetical protein PFISCL1PPCAC_4294, partial [Pristionchus fissidentatus]
RAAFIWTITLLLGFGRLFGSHNFDRFISVCSFISICVTFLLYTITLVYFKVMKAEYRREIPVSVVRTTLSSFLLCATDSASSFIFFYLE